MSDKINCDECGRTLSSQEIEEISNEYGMPERLVLQLIINYLCSRCGGGYPVVEMEDSVGFNEEDAA